jgi:hypothetical protein
VDNDSWNTDAFSQESFVGDGYAIFTLSATSARKAIMLGLSTDKLVKLSGNRITQ